MALSFCAKNASPYMKNKFLGGFKNDYTIHYSNGADGVWSMPYGLDRNTFYTAVFSSDMCNCRSNNRSKDLQQETWKERKQC